MKGARWTPEGRLWTGEAIAAPNRQRGNGEAGISPVPLFSGHYFEMSDNFTEFKNVRRENDGS
jgi:hypothetical protein